MADIKTRDVVKGTIKKIDKAAIAADRMRSAYVHTKEMFPRRRKTGSKKKSTTAQPPGQTLSVSPAGLAMRSEKCTARACRAV